MESAISNLTRPADRVVVVSAGHFGERWAAMAGNFGCDVDTIEYEWGETPSADDLSARLAETGGAKVVFLTHSETSTGVVSDVHPLRPPRRSQARSSSSMPSRAWGRPARDGLLGARRRRLGIAEGADDAARPRHRLGLERRLGRGDAPGRYYFDWHETRDRQEQFDPAFTPAVSIVVGLDVALGSSRRAWSRRSSATPAWVAPAAPASGPWAWSSSRRTTTARPWSPRSPRLTGSTPASSCRRCATARGSSSRRDRGR